ncbi:hypothetical protein ACFSUK_16825 [Sphingobium scionense]
MDNREVELKLEFDPADRALLAQAPLFAGQEGQVAHLVATYFDTPGLDLHRAGFPCASGARGVPMSRRSRRMAARRLVSSPGPNGKGR